MVKKRGKSNNNAKFYSSKFENNKGQVTLIIIIGLIILMVSGVMFYVFGESASNKGENAIKNQEDSRALLAPVDEYITDCLNVVAGEALEILGKQGGYIFKSQGGIIPDFPSKELGEKFVNFDDSKIPYSIFRPSGQVGVVFYSDIPRYPWITFPQVIDVFGNVNKTIYLEGFFGKSNLPQLLPPYPNSIKFQLEQFTINKIESCVDWQQFKQRGISIQIGTPNATVNILEKNIIFNLFWQLDISSEVTGAKAKIEKFQIVYPLRLPQLYEVLNYAVGQDITNINFSLSTYEAGPIITNVYHDIFLYDDVVVFEDLSSKIIDKTFKFFIGRQDRPPALFYLDPDKIINEKICINTTIRRSINPTNTTDELIFENSCGPSFRVPLKALDPDENPISFSFSLFALNNNQTFTLTRAEVLSGKMGITVFANSQDKSDFQDIIILTK